jgi:molybdopterin-containing oxidoreductase family iron-sulfur binding subunit
LFYASSFIHRGVATGILVQTHEGRPTKIEGNPDHPGSLGSTDPWMQASVLSLYDPDRSKVVRRDGLPATLDSFYEFVRNLPGSGEGIRILMEPTTSPTEIELLRKLKSRYPGLRVHQYEPVSARAIREADRLAFGEELSRIYHFDRAKTIVSLNHDFLSREDARVRYAREFSELRRVRRDRFSESSLFVAESHPSLVGAMADARLRLKPEEIEHVCSALWRALEESPGGGVTRAAPPTMELSAETKAWLGAVLAKLRSSRGESLVLAGEDLPTGVHLQILRINERLVNVGKTLEWIPSIYPETSLVSEDLGALVTEMKAGKIGVLLMLGGNPVYDAPSDLEFKEALTRVKERVHLSYHYDETSHECTWHIPRSHELESWGDARAYDGSVSLIQPVIAPMVESKTVSEVLGNFLQNFTSDSHTWVTELWKSRQKLGEVEFRRFWESALHRGVIEKTASVPRKNLKFRTEHNARTAEMSENRTGLELVFCPDPLIWDGRFANNAWLQELPKPITQVAWDNVIAVSPRTAAAQGWKNGDVIEVKIPPERTTGPAQESRAIEGPVFIVPGHADGVLSVQLGFGRTCAGAIGNGVGFNVYPIRTSRNPWRIPGVSARKTGKSHEIARTQTHHSMEGREIVSVKPLSELHTAKSKVPEAMEQPSLFAPYLPEELARKTEAWAMSIDLNVCIGCKTCMIACQAENNIPVVGKEQVLRTREMHWIRVDSYFQGTTESPKIYFQPVPCMHCENAPCELVCPTEATHHSDDGLNQMVYNRCIGTRYCSNNCPYKVRRFNFLAYSKSIGPLERLQANPDVTIRSRGVMEKCTYCVQRINAARMIAEKESRPIRDGEIRTACEAACPTQAITFGNKNDPSSRVARLREEPLAYSLLEELGTRPRTTYLARAERKTEVPESGGAQS